MLSYEQPSLYIITVVALVVAFTASCRQEVQSREVETKVTSFDYRFGLEYRVVKNGPFCAIEQSDLWTDSQVPPPSDFDEAPYLMLISNGDCEKILAMITAVDWNNYADLDDSDFEATPPGMQFRERLLVTLDGETRVDWIKSYHRLKGELRKPLEKIEEVITTIATEKRANAVLPNDFSLELSVNSGGESENWKWEFANGEGLLTSGQESRQLTVERFAPLWIAILNLRVLGAEYAPLDTDSAGNGEARTDLLHVVVNGMKLVDFQFDAPYENQARVDKLRSLLSQASGN